MNAQDNLQPDVMTRFMLMRPAAGSRSNPAYENTMYKKVKIPRHRPGNLFIFNP
jgi:hypothetical protein